MRTDKIISPISQSRKSLKLISKARLKNAALALGVIAASVVWLILEIYRWNGSHLLPTSSARLAMGLFGFSYTNDTIFLYTCSGGTAIWAYLIFTFLPKHSVKIRNFSKGRPLLWFAVSFAAVLPFLLLTLTCSRFYFYGNRLFGYRWNINFKGLAIKDDNETYVIINYIVTHAALLASVVAALFFGIKEHRDKLGEATLTSCSRCIYILVLALISTALCGAVLCIVKHYNRSAAELVVRFFETELSSRSGAYVGVILGPICEEAMFRGLMLEKLKRRVPTRLALIFTSVCFGLWHRNLGQFCYTSLTGLTFGGVYLMTNKLRYVWLMHGALNLFSFMAMGNYKDNWFYPLARPLQWCYKEIMSFPLGMAIGFSVLMLAIIVVLFCLYKSFDKAGIKSLSHSLEG